MLLCCLRVSLCINFFGCIVFIGLVGVCKGSVTPSPFASLCRWRRSCISVFFIYLYIIGARVHILSVIYPLETFKLACRWACQSDVSYFIRSSLSMREGHEFQFPDSAFPFDIIVMSGAAVFSAVFSSALYWQSAEYFSTALGFYLPRSNPIIFFNFWSLKVTSCAIRGG